MVLNATHYFNNVKSNNQLKRPQYVYFDKTVISKVILHIFWILWSKFTINSRYKGEKEKVALWGTFKEI